MQREIHELPGVISFTPRRFPDTRGYFVEIYNERTLSELGVKARFVQDNQSFSSQERTIRALHFQKPPAAQGKLVRVVQGSMYDVVVDLRVGSPAYGDWAGVKLTAEGGEQLFVPRGLAHGFCTLEPNTIVAYKVDAFYDKPAEDGFRWDDPTIAIDWPFGSRDPVLSDKDLELGEFAGFQSPFTYEG